MTDTTSTTVAAHTAQESGADGNRNGAQRKGNGVCGGVSMQYQHGHPIPGKKSVEKFCPLCYNTPQKHPKAVVEISENEIAKILILVLCLVACFPLHCGHYLDDGL